MPRRQPGMQRSSKLLRGVRVSFWKVLRTDGRLVLVHERLRLLLEQLHPESMHVRSAGVFVHRRRAMLRWAVLRIGHVHLSSRHPRLQLGRARGPPVSTQPLASA